MTVSAVISATATTVTTTPAMIPAVLSLSDSAHVEDTLSGHVEATLSASQTSDAAVGKRQQ